MPNLSRTLARAAAIAALAAGLGLPAATPSLAGTDGASFTVIGFAHTICRVDYSDGATPIVGQTTDLGQFTELCNDGAGYTVTLVTPAGLAGSSAIVDGTTIPLAANGRTIIVDSNSTAYKKQDLKIQLAAGSTAFAKVTFEATPKGSVF